MVKNFRRGEEPGYRRLAASLRQDIDSQTWDEVTPLPTDGQLAQSFGVSRQTVRRAYLELVNDGLVYRVPGRGTFITPRHLRYHRPFATVDDLLALSSDTELEVVDPLAGTFDTRAASELNLDSRLMYGMRFLRRHQGVVFCVTTVFLPPRIGALIEHDAAFTTAGARTTTTVIGALVAHGIHISGADQSITAYACSSTLARQLDYAEGQPLLHVERSYLDPVGSPVEFAISDFLPEHYTHRLHLGRRLTAVKSSYSPPDEQGVSI